MALFKKKTTDADVFNAEPPMSGGNTKAIYEAQKAQIELDRATIAYYKSIDKTVSDVLKETFAGEQYDIWRLLNFQADYFCNLFTVESDGFNLVSAIQTAQRVAFLYGVSGIYRQNGRLIPFYIIKSKVGIDGTFSEIDIAPASTILPLQSQFPKKFPVRFSLKEQEIKQDCAILKWDTLALGAWYKFLPFINQQKRMLSMMSAEGWNLIKKSAWRVNDPTALLEELKVFYNPELPFAINGKTTDELGNKIDMWQTNSNSTNTFMNFFDEWQNQWYQLIGRRNNTDFKKERNVTNEVEASQSNFDILETDHYLHFKMFIKQLEVLLGMDIIIRSIYNNDEEADNDI